MIEDILYVEGDEYVLEIQVGILGDLNIPQDILHDTMLLLEIPSRIVNAETSHLFC